MDGNKRELQTEVINESCFMYPITFVATHLTLRWAEMPEHLLFDILKCRRSEKMEMNERWIENIEMNKC